MVEDMKKQITLTRNGEFKRLYHKGRSFPGSLVITYVYATKRNYNRFGITASKKIGCAVKRNRARRLIKEAFRLLSPRLCTGYDFVFIARTKTTLSTLHAVQATVQKQLTEAGVFVGEQPGDAGEGTKKPVFQEKSR